jgi:hypothetical protein
MSCFLWVISVVLLCMQMFNFSFLPDLVQPSPHLIYESASHVMDTHFTLPSLRTTPHTDLCGVLHPSGWLVLAASPQVYCCLGLQGTKRSIRGLCGVPAKLADLRQAGKAGLHRSQTVLLPSSGNSQHDSRRMPPSRSPYLQSETAQDSRESGTFRKSGSSGMREGVRYLVPVKLQGLGLQPKQLARVREAFARIAIPVACRISALQAGEAVVCICSSRTLFCWMCMCCRHVWHTRQWPTCHF